MIMWTLITYQKIRLEKKKRKKEIWTLTILVLHLANKLHQIIIVHEIWHVLMLL